MLRLLHTMPHIVKSSKTFLFRTLYIIISKILSNKHCILLIRHISYCDNPVFCTDIIVSNFYSNYLLII